MTTKDKVYLTIILALVISFFSYNRQCPDSPASERSVGLPTTNGRDTTLAYLEETYLIYNDEYFDSKLPQDVKIDLNEPVNIASTDCTSNNTNCILHFNPHYIAAPRYAVLTLLHEMCHIPTYEEHVPGATGQLAMHGPQWRFCMLKLDIAGANRYILIDGYEPKEKRSVVFK